jgi:hypothetical protein
MKWLHREIVSSDAYQRSWKVNETNQHDQRNFSHAMVRRLPAEVIVDAVEQSTASAAKLEALARDMELRSFGPRGTASYGRGGGGDFAARVFGRSARDTNCDCSRSDEPNLLQAIYLQNHNEILTKLQRADGWVAELQKADRAARADSDDPADQRATRIRFLEDRIRRVGDDPKKADQRQDLERELTRLRKEKQEQEATAGAEAAAAGPVPGTDELIAEAFLRTVNRPPTADEQQAARDYFREEGDAPAAVHDLLWALINTKEFSTTH